MKKHLNNDNAAKKNGSGLTLEKLQEPLNNSDLRDDELRSIMGGGTGGTKPGGLTTPPTLG
jgi:hypothetical protein